jgi:DNA-binding SARP family transcriptional activator
LLAHIAQAYRGPVVWCGSPDPVPRTEAAFAAWLANAMAVARLSGTNVPECPPDPGSIDVIADLLGGPGPSVLFIFDDIHLVEGHESEVALARLIARAPGRLRVVLSSRVKLDIDLSRLRVSGQVVDIGPDELRFRTWEVEELFRDVYGEPLLPEDVAALARRTAGWAAYLQLFFLATARKTLAERRRVLASLTRSRLVSEFLGRHVLAGLRPELEEFLVRTSVLRRPTGAICDEFLDRRSGSSEMLAELERRQLFTERLDDDAYRYHAVLLSYLDSKLVDTLGIAAAKEEHHRAALILERDGWTEDALAAFAKSEDWEGVARLLGHPDSPPPGFGDTWIDALPPAVVESDALLLIVRAQGALSRGALADAAGTLRLAENVAVSTAVAERCRILRDQVLCWTEPGRPTGDDWSGLVRKATQRQPLEALRLAVAIPGADGRFAEGLIAFLAGNLNLAARSLRTVANHPEAPPAMAAAASLVAGLASAGLGRHLGDQEMARLREEIEVSGIPWLERVSRAFVTSLEPGDLRTLDDLIDACQREGDRWGEAVIAGIGGLSRLYSRDGEAADLIGRAARIFGDLGAGVLESSAMSLAALAWWDAGRHEEAKRLAAQARTVASLADSPAGAGLAGLTLARLFDDDREMGRAQESLVDIGLWDRIEALESRRCAPPGSSSSESSSPESSSPATSGPAEAATALGPPEKPVYLQCLGSFYMNIGGRSLDESTAKPMERSLLHLLSIRCGESVHREELIEALWPDADPEAGLHRLQVAVSAVRRLLSAAGGDGARMLVRDGDAYRFALPEGAEIDIRAFEAAVLAAQGARSVGDREAERRLLTEALAAYRGPLLPGDGPAEWLVGARSRFQSAFADVATRLAGLLLEGDLLQLAADTARSGLRVDRYRDELWKLLIEATERAGNHAEASRARLSYESVLRELGV